MATDIFGVRLEVGQRVLWATAWHHYAALHTGTLIAVEPTPVVQPDGPGAIPLPRPPQALAVIYGAASAELWLRRRLSEIDED
jgi:hypothetical protein